MLKIVTDSTAGIPPAECRQHDIHVVPLCVHFGDQAFKEGIELSNDEFYARLRAAPELPTTSQPSAGEFYEVYKKLANAGHEVVVLTISSKLSGTWNSAVAARDMLPGAPITVVDSLSTSVGMHLMIHEALPAIAAGASRQEIAALWEGLRDRIQILFVVDTLEYLAKGGRIGNAKAFLGTLLKVKPILILQDGQIEPLEQVRSKNKATARILDLVSARLDGHSAEAKVAIAHGMVPADADAVKQEIVARFGCAEPLVSEIGPVLGAHAGPGLIGVAAYA